MHIAIRRTTPTLACARIPPPRPHIPPHPTRHIERDDGPVMQFHSFYRDIRSELTGINGWSQNLGRYMREAEYK